MKQTRLIFHRFGATSHFSYPSGKYVLMEQLCNLVFLGFNLKKSTSPPI